MPSSAGNKLKVQIFGQSHSAGLGVVIDGLPSGEKIDMAELNAFLRRRAGGKNAWSTPRAEPDLPDILSGLVNDTTCGAPLCAVFENTNTRRQDYDEFRAIPRPSHADYTAFIKHSGRNDASGGGHFSGRLTLPLCFAGAVCVQILKRKGVSIDAHIHSIGNVTDEPLDLSGNVSFQNEFPTISKNSGDRMIALIAEASAEGDSVGGVVECRALGLPAGLGEPFFDTLESRLAYSLFAVPAVKGVEFGAGFAAAAMRGSEFNDPFYMDNGKVKTRTNHSGGILGGISNGMPIILRAAFKPTPSIAKEQQTVNLATGEDTTIAIKGRHDPCIVPRAVPCVIAATAITILDVILGG